MVIIIIIIINVDIIITMNIPDNSKHESLNAGNAKVIVWLFSFILQDVLHYEDHVLNKHRVYVTHNCLPHKHIQTGYT